MEIEYRYEQKFVISDFEADALKSRLKCVMPLDKHSVSIDYSYLIRSLYFDTPYDSALYEKMNGDEIRLKYRIRIYNYDSSLVDLECKHKDSDYTRKENVVIDRTVAEALIAGKPASDPVFGSLLAQSRFFQRFMAERSAQALKPTVLVDYKRLAFTYPASEVRITFDSDIRSGKESVDLFNPNLPTVSVCPPGQQVLEVKCNDFIPSHILSILQSVPMARQAISKFAHCRLVSDEI